MRPSSITLRDVFIAGLPLKIVELIETSYDEYLRQTSARSGLPVEPSRCWCTGEQRTRATRTAIPWWLST